MQVHSNSKPGVTQRTSRPNGLMGWLIDFFLRPRGGRGGDRHMQLIETLSLGGKRQLMLVKCNGEDFLVGAGTDGVQTIVALRADRDANKDMEFLS